MEAEYAFLALHFSKRHKDWKMICQSLIETDDGTPVDALEFTVGDEEHTVYFNMAKSFPACGGCRAVCDCYAVAATPGLHRTSRIA